VSKRIVVIDRSRIIQVLLSTYFRNAGHQVITCSTQNALELFAGLRDAPDIIFLAIDFEKKAYKVTQYAKEHGKYAHTCFIAMVLQEEKKDIQLALSGSNVRYLVKPFHIQDALALVSAPLPGAAASSGTRIVERDGT
jgi:CheY-like chemotaxis protein